MSLNLNKTLLAIPCFNCAPQIKRVIQKLGSTDLSDITEIIFINNYSTDQTKETIENGTYSTISNKIKISLLNHKENYGLGGSFKTAVNYAKSNNIENLIWFHGDDQADTRDINNMYKYFDKSQKDCIFGARFMSGSKLKNYSHIRDIGNQFLNLIYEIFLGEKIYELGSGLNIYKVNPIYESQIDLWPTHIAFDLNLIFLFIKSRNSYDWFPIRWEERDQISNADNFKVGFKILQYLFIFLIRRRYILVKKSKNQEYTQIPLSPIN